MIVEHTSINPNKAAHIGHVRNSILGDTFVRLLQARGHEVLTQNYIDDTGVQVADVIVGFEQLEKKSLADVRALDDRFDYYCWDLYARVFEWYGEDKERKALQAATLHAIEKHEGPTAELGEYVAARIVRAHIATMARLDIGYDLLVRESDILRQHFWAKAFDLLKGTKAIEFENEGKAKGCWVLKMDATDGGIDENKIIVRSNGTVTYTGKDIAYQLWKLGKLGLDFRYRRHEDSTPARPLWSSTSGSADEGAPAFGAGASLVFNVIDVGQSYPQRVVKAGVAAVAGPEPAEGTRHLGYEKVVLSKATAKELGYEVDEDAGVVKVSGRRGLGVKADDLIDALETKASHEIATRDPERTEADRTKAAHDIAVGALRYFMLRFSRNRIITFDMEEALAFTGETGPYIQNSVVRAKNILVKVASEGHDVQGPPHPRPEQGSSDPMARHRGRLLGVVPVSRHGPHRRGDRNRGPDRRAERHDPARLPDRPGVPRLLPEPRAQRSARRDRRSARGARSRGRSLRPAHHRRGIAARHSHSGSHVSGPRPRIVITAGSNPGTTNHAWLRFDYLHAISKAHGLPEHRRVGFHQPPR